MYSNPNPNQNTYIIFYIIYIDIDQPYHVNYLAPKLLFIIINIRDNDNYSIITSG